MGGANIPLPTPVIWYATTHRDFSQFSPAKVRGRQSGSSKGKLPNISQKWLYKELDSWSLQSIAPGSGFLASKALLLLKIFLEI